MNEKFLSKVYGYKDIKQELYNIYNWYLNTEETKKGLLPKGILLYGEPGGGKTFIMKKYAEEFNCPVYIIDGNNEGASEEVIKKYKLARKEKFAIVIIDELDKLIANDIKLTRILQTQLDGFETNYNVLTLASSNYRSQIPEPLLRQGRFNRQLNMNYISSDDLIDIVKNLCQEIGFNYDNDEINEITQIFDGSVPSYIKSVLQDTYLRFGSNATPIDIINSDRMIEDGFNNNDLIITNDLSIHEAGHALFVYKNDPFRKFLRVVFNNKGGKTIYKRLYKFESIESIEKNIQSSLAGIIAEKIVLGKYNIGCKSDLKKTYEFSKTLIIENGILGYEYFLDDDYFARCRVYSNKKIYELEKKIKKYIHKQYKITYNLLKKEKENLILLKDYIYKNKYLSRDDLERIIKL